MIVGDFAFIFETVCCTKFSFFGISRIFLVALIDAKHEFKKLITNKIISFYYNT